jgi:hypothetical protein
MPYTTHHAPPRSRHAAAAQQQSSSSSAGKAAGAADSSAHYSYAALPSGGHRSCARYAACGRARAALTVASVAALAAPAGCV